MKSNRFSSFACALPTLALTCAVTVHCVQLQDSGDAMKQWGVAERIHTEGEAPDVAVDATGNAVVVWVQVQENGIWSSRYSRGTEPAWSAAERIDRPGADVLDRLAVAMGARGDAIAVWAEFFTYDNVFANRSTSDGTWGTFPAHLDDNRDATRWPPDSGPEVSMNADGTAVAVWVQVDSLQEDVWAARATPGGVWEPPQGIETSNATRASGPQVAVDPDGNAIAVWAMIDGVTSNIWSNRYTTGIGWGTNASRIENNNAGDSNAPQVGLDAQGNAIAVWSRSNGERYDIWSNRYTPGVGWDATPQRIEFEDEGDAIDPDVAVLSDGRAFAVWSQFDGTNSDIWSNRYTPGATWGTAQRIEVNEAGSAVAPRIAGNPFGTAAAVWRQLGAAGGSIWANHYTPNGGWGDARPIDAGDRAQGVPRIAMDPNGNAVAVWTVSGGVNEGVWSNWLQ